MIKETQKALDMAGELKKLVNSLIHETSNLDLQRLFKQIDADLMDITHKLASAVKLAGDAD